MVQKYWAGSNGQLMGAPDTITGPTSHDSQPPIFLHKAVLALSSLLWQSPVAGGGSTIDKR